MFSDKLTFTALSKVSELAPTGNATTKELLLTCRMENPLIFRYSLAKSWYTNTWVSQEGMFDVMHTDQGPLARTPFADVAYLVAMSRVLTVFRNSFAIRNIE